MKHTPRFAAAVLAAVVLAACAGARDGAAPAGPSADPASPGQTVASPSLLGTTWRLVSVDGHEAVAGVRVTAVFSDENRVAGSAGCNHYFGSAAVEGGQLKVGGLGATKMFCGAAGVMPQEEAYLSALGKAAVYRVVGTELHLGPAPGTVTLVFKAE